MSDTGFRAVQSLYWLGLGVWLGAMIMIFLSARSTFDVLPRYQPTVGIAPYDHPNLTQYAPRILAGAVNGATLKKLGVLQLICAAVVFVCMIIQCTSGKPWLEAGGRHWANTWRIALLLVPVLVLAVEAFVLEPKLLHQRDVMYQPELEAAQRERERATFGRLHGISMALNTASAATLLGALVLSPFVFRGPSRDATPAAPSVIAEDAPRG